MTTTHKLAFGLIVATLVVSGYRASAHHSFAATYIESAEITIEGDLVQFLYRNPHSFVHVIGYDTSDTTKAQHRYSAEWGGGSRLNQEGVTRDTLRPGDHVIITGSPGRNPADHRLRMASIHRPRDGWKWAGVVD